MTWFKTSGNMQRLGYTLVIGGMLTLPAFGQAGGGGGASGGSSGGASGGSTSGASSTGSTGSASSTSGTGSGANTSGNRSNATSGAGQGTSWSRTSVPRDGSTTWNSTGDGRANISQPRGSSSGSFDASGRSTSGSSAYGQYDRGRYGDRGNYNNPYATSGSRSGTSSGGAYDSSAGSSYDSRTGQYYDSRGGQSGSRTGVADYDNRSGGYSDYRTGQYDDGRMGRSGGLDSDSRAYDARSGTRFDTSARSQFDSSGAYGNVDRFDDRQSGHFRDSPSGRTQISEPRGASASGQFPSNPSQLRFDSSTGLYTDASSGRTFFYDANSGRFILSDRSAGRFNTTSGQFDDRSRYSARGQIDSSSSVDVSRLSFDSNTGLYTDYATGRTYRYDSRSGQYLSADQGGYNTTYGNIDRGSGSRAGTGYYDDTSRSYDRSSYDRSYDNSGYDNNRYGSDQSWQNRQGSRYDNQAQGRLGTTTRNNDAGVDYNYRSDTGYQRSTGATSGMSGTSSGTGSTTYRSSSDYNTNSSSGYYDAQGRWHSYSSDNDDDR